MVSIDRPTVNMRTGPGTEYPATWQLARGYPLTVVGRKGSWLRVRDFENDEGWVYRPLVGKKPYLVVRVKSLNVRSAPSTKARIVGKAEYGVVLQTLRRSQGWVQVRHETGLSGWVASKHVWGW
jgi:SH3-like domain-containing protein